MDDGTEAVTVEHAGLAEAAARPGSGPEAASGGGPAFEPRIVAFCCYYCAYSAADLAGSMRLQYPPNVRLIEVPCSGRVDPALLLRALEEGADGVYVAGCMEGDCHFQQGNFRAKRRVGAIKKLLSQIGWEPERVEMYNVPASDGARFAQVAREFTERIRQMGPNPVRVKKVRS